MGMSPQEREDMRANQATERHLQDRLALVTTVLSARPGWGERLLPYLVATMETCWVDAVLIALASVNLFQRRTPLLPLWVPFLLIASACWLLIFLERREAASDQAVESRQKRVSGSAWFILLQAFLVLMVVWASIYASSFLFFDPRWLLTFLNDVFQVDGNFYYALVLAAFSLYFCWRGARLAHRSIEPASIFWNLRLGMGIIIVAIIVYVGGGGGSFNELILFSIVPLFLFCALVAHALAKALFLRHNAPGGLLGSVAGQERAILAMMTAIGLLILLLALGIGSFASPAFLQGVQRGLEPLGRLYDWLVNIIAYGITFLVYPLFWLISLFHIQVRAPKLSDASKPIIHGHPQAQGAEPLVTLLVPVLKIVLPVLFILGMILFIRVLLRKRRIRLVSTEPQDLSESIWSWNLFIAQLKEFLLLLWLRFFPRRVNKQEMLEGDSTEEETIRNIRALYRALLRWSASRGYGRRKEETPYEFKERLQQKIPQGELELENLTEAYAGLRYGDHVPDDEEVIRVQKDWVALQRKILPL